MSTDIEEWIAEAMQNLSLVNRRLETQVAEDLTARAHRTFVNGSPRVWWLSLKFEPEQRWSNRETELVQLSEAPDEFGYFIPETDGQLPVYRLTARESQAVIYDCPYFEYNFLDERLTTLIIETHHNEFLVVKTP